MMHHLKSAFVPTESEVAANHAGMNTFFGAVLGFVMAGTEKLDNVEFAYMLFMVAGVVISILYVSASRQKIVYAALSVGLILLLPKVFSPVFEAGESVPEKLQPTLLMWVAMALFVELMPRRADEAATQAQPAVEATLSGRSEPNTR
ncbi:hypothetical protein G7078_02285 [Sphingomonas sinipercae]|uniref:Uncharacterized protein n=1 Tax=Sphingomonas sinipercae TaxID=2714944 RepID=A0A6G7ZLD1_9SPHN|nr:hypothetical protein [Sphingomonas sinipercae]QIL01728.1 hypothetical protein G7078_02285 [Sphingomonas sinipercae]